jgi:hypothetical protein
LIDTLVATAFASGAGVATLVSDKYGLLRVSQALADEPPGFPAPLGLVVTID